MTLASGPRQKPRHVRETDYARLEQHLRDLSMRYRQQCAEVSPGNAKYMALAKLYAGAQRLHQAVKEGAVAEAIVEIGSNLIGCEQMAVIVASGKRKNVDFIGSVGLNRKQLKAVRMSAREIIEEATGSVYIANDGGKPDPLLQSLGITAFVPFWLDYTTKGAIAFFDLLPQRNGLDSTDRELLTLLRAYAGPCLSTSKQNRRRRLNECHHEAAYDR